MLQSKQGQPPEYYFGLGILFEQSLKNHEPLMVFGKKVNKLDTLLLSAEDQIENTNLSKRDKKAARKQITDFENSQNGETHERTNSESNSTLGNQGKPINFIYRRFEDRRMFRVRNAFILVSQATRFWSLIRRRPRNQSSQN